MGRRALWGVILLAWMVSGCLSSNPRLDTDPSAHEPKVLELEPQQHGKFKIFDKYALVPGDVLDVLFQVETWKVDEQFAISVDDQLTIKFVHAPELDVEQQVRPDGAIAMPYLGQVKASGKTVDQLTRELKKAYATILRDPQLYIVIAGFRSRIQDFKQDLRTAPRGLSRLVTVRPDGVVTFPLVGDLMVVERTVPQITEELNRLYAAIMPGLRVNVFLHEQAGAHIYVLGEVTHPGAYRVRRPTSILEALALAGGAKSSAKLEHILVLRREKERVLVYRMDGVRELTLDSPLLLPLQPEDTVFVARTHISYIAELMGQVGDAIFFKGVTTGMDWQFSDRPISNWGTGRSR